MSKTYLGLAIITGALITSVIIPELRDSYGAIVPSAINAVVLLTTDTHKNDEEKIKKNQKRHR